MRRPTSFLVSSDHFNECVRRDIRYHLLGRDWRKSSYNT
nr:MAG TPA: hypothetical protein [Caudoviricetes sp.]